jgi:hypothetical protein
MWSPTNIQTPRPTALPRHTTRSITNTAKPGEGSETSRTEFGPATREDESGEAEEIRRVWILIPVMNRRVNVV